MRGAGLGDPEAGVALLPCQGNEVTAARITGTTRPGANPPYTLTKGRQRLGWTREATSTIGLLQKLNAHFMGR